jgi:putative transposase
MHRLLSNEKFLHWPIISVAHYGIRKSLVQAHPNTWYKYARIMKLQRKRFRRKRKVYDEGLRANAPNEMWHADITQFETADGKTSYIYLVVDNFSRSILSWRVSDKKSGRIRLDTFVEAIRISGIQGQENTTDLIVDQGSENNNKRIETFIEKYPVDKLIALKDILYSNSMVESVNKLIKYDYLYPKNIRNRVHLKNYMGSFVIPDYNDFRPHGALNGLTPTEAYRNKKVNVKRIRAKMEKANQERICYNQSNECPGCPFGCKSRLAS